MTQAPATPELVESDDWALEIAACGFANDSTLPESVRSFIKDLWRAYCEVEQRAEASQALADRYEKALRAAERLARSGEHEHTRLLDIRDLVIEALSSQGRHEGGEG